MTDYNANQKADKTESLKKKAIKIINKHAWPFLKMLVWFLIKEILKSIFSKDES